jgi:hypothetical protein
LLLEKLHKAITGYYANIPSGDPITGFGEASKYSAEVIYFYYTFSDIDRIATGNNMVAITKIDYRGYEVPAEKDVSEQRGLRTDNTFNPENPSNWLNSSNLKKYGPDGDYDVYSNLTLKPPPASQGYDKQIFDMVTAAKNTYQQQHPVQEPVQEPVQ